MTATVTRILPGPAVRSDIAQAVVDLEEAIIEAIHAAKDAGVPQGFVCAIMRTHEQLEIEALIQGDD